MKIKGKRGLESEMMGKIAILIIVLIVVLGGYMIMKWKGYDAIEYLKEFLKFRR